MASRFLPILSGRLLWVIAIAALCISLAHAQQAQPGLLESLGNLLKPKEEAPAREAGASATPDASRNLAVAGNGRRVALVIGNAAYPGAGALKNPANDATDIAAKLKRLGFDVTVRTDMPYRDMLRALTDFGDKVQTGTEALFFYAGHGMQVRGKNYLIPIDAQIRNESAVSSEAVDVDQLLDKLAPARLSMVILDACRNNPFERRFRGSGQGLASINAPTGTLIAYATAPGKVAADGEGRNGLYTAELLTAMDAPGIKVEDVFKRVRSNVVRKSGEAQTPWESSSLTGDFYFVGGQLASLGPQIVGGRSREQIEDELWDAIKDGDKVSVFEEYLKQYPNGRYLAQARVNIAKLKGEARQPAALAAVPSAPTPAAASSDPETALWSEAQKGDTADDYDVYLKQYPKGKYIALAKQRVQKLKDEAKQQAEAAEQGAWRAAEAAQTPEGYAAYLASYPRGRYAALAQTRSNKLKNGAAVQEETQLWQAAEKGGKTDVDSYLGRYPRGRYAATAQLKLAQITARAAEEERKAREEAARGAQWEESDNGADINWNEATQYCASNGNGWRLPTSAELQASYQSGHSTPCGSYAGAKFACKVSSNSNLTGAWLWTNERSGSSVAWHVNLINGTRDAARVRDRDGLRALCVRRP